MGEIRTLPGVTNTAAPIGLQPVDGIIEELALMLDDARSGKLRAFAAATVRVGDYTGSVWCRPPNGDCGHSLAAAIGFLQHRYNADMVGSSRPRSEADPA